MDRPITSDIGDAKPKLWEQTLFFAGTNNEEAGLSRKSCISTIFLNWYWTQFDFVVFSYFSKTTIHGTQQSLLRSARRSSLWNTSRWSRNSKMSDFHLVLNLCCEPAPSSWTTTYFFSLLRNVLILLKAFPPLLLFDGPSYRLFSTSSSPISSLIPSERGGLLSSAALLLLLPCFKEVFGFILKTCKKSNNDWGTDVTLEVKNKSIIVQFVKNTRLYEMTKWFYMVSSSSLNASAACSRGWQGCQGVASCLQMENYKSKEHSLQKEGIVLYSKVCGGAKSYTTITIQNMRFKR